MLSLKDLSRTATVPYCGRELIKDLSFAERFEYWVAATLNARIAAARNMSYDVYESEPFPGLTFQVKAANARAHDVIQKDIGDRAVTVRQAPTWTWAEYLDGAADMYVLFGVKDRQVYPFLAPLHIWQGESTTTGKGRIMTMCSNEYSSCGRYTRSSKRNKFWQYYLPTWPDDLFRRLEYYTKTPVLDQSMLCEELVPYVVLN